MCSKLNCNCHANRSKVNERLIKFIKLVQKTAEEEQLPVSRNSTNNRTTIQVIHISNTGPTTISLTSIYGSYFHNAEADDDCFTTQNSQIVCKPYFGPCGGLLVFGARDDFKASAVNFASGSGPAELICQYNESNPVDQFLFVVCVPLQICTACRHAMDVSYKCSRCKAISIHARYCSRECQVKHWPVHKAVCGRRLEQQ